MSASIRYARNHWCALIVFAGLLVSLPLVGTKETDLQEVKITNIRVETAPDGQRYAILTFVSPGENVIYDIQVTDDLQHWTTLGPADFQELEPLDELVASGATVQTRLNI